jgi:hypothetical protein
MSDEPIVRRKGLGALKIAGLIALTLAVLCGGSIVWIGCEGRAQMREIAAETPRLIAEIRARNVRRPVLYGESLPGRAWDEYTKAFTAIDLYKGNEEQRKSIVDYLLTGKGDASDLDKILAMYGPALAHLSAGTHREDGSMALEWERGESMDLPGLLASQNLSNLACAEARRLATEGKYRKAIDAISDILMLGHDVAFNGVLITHMIGLAIYGTALEALMTFVGDQAFPAAELAELARRLELVDGSFPPPAHSFTNDTMMFRVALLNGELGAGEVPTISLLSADGIRKMDAYAARCAELSRKPWNVVQGEMVRLGAHATSAWNPILRLATPGLVAAERSIRERHAHLRLVRSYVNFRLKTSGPALDDPLGVKILGAGPRFWSAGRNGADDGGSGSWKFDGLDIVLDVTNK